MDSKPEQEVIPEVDTNVDKLVPQLNVSAMQKKEDDKPPIVSDEALISMFGNILNEIKTDKDEVSEVLSKVMDMVLNEGDSSTSTKEAMVNLFKIKTDMADKATKVAELMTRVALKEKDTFPRYLAATQNNTVKITTSASRKKLLQAINKEMKQKKEDGNEQN